MAQCPFAHGAPYSLPAVAGATQPKAKPKPKAQANAEAKAQAAIEKAKTAQRAASQAMKAAKGLVAIHPDVLAAAAAANSQSGE